MIVQKISDLSDKYKVLLDKNPLTDQIHNNKKKIESAQSVIISNNNRIKELENQKNSYRADQIKREVEIRHLTKINSILEAEGTKVDCSFDMLNEEEIVKFMEAIGCKFVSLAFGDNTAVLTYIKNATKLHTLTIPPMVVKIEYYITDGTYFISNAYCKASHVPALNSSREAYFHPHIRIINCSENNVFFGEVCMGNYFDQLRSSNVQFTLANFQDHVILLNNLISTYNPDSPFITLHDLKYNYSYRELLPVMGRVNILHDCPVAIISPELRSTSRTLFSVQDIIPRSFLAKFNQLVNESPKDMETYFDMCQTIAQGNIDNITDNYDSDDDENFTSDDVRDLVINFYKSIGKLTKEIDTGIFEIIFKSDTEELLSGDLAGYDCYLEILREFSNKTRQFNMHFDSGKITSETSPQWAKLIEVVSSNLEVQNLIRGIDD